MNDIQQTLLDFIEAKFGKDCANWLVNIHKGGSSNQKGNRYEQYFTVYKAFQLASNHSLIFDKQLLCNQTLGFVDDICHIDKQHNIKYNYQAKNSDNASADWTADITTRFTYQHIIDTEFLKFNQSNNLLVVSNQVKWQNNQSKIPSELQTTAQCIYFPDCHSTLELIENTDIREFVVKLIDGSSIDKIDYALKLILGIIQSNQQQDIQSIFNQASVEGHPNPFVKFNRKETLTKLPHWIVNLLEHAEIPISYQISYGNLIVITESQGCRFTVTTPVFALNNIPNERIVTINNLFSLLELLMELAAKTL